MKKNNHSKFNNQKFNRQNFNKQKWIKIIGALGIGVILVIGMIWAKRPPVETVSYTIFNEILKSGQIEEVELTSGEKFSFKKKGEGIIYKATNPRAENFKERLLLEGVEVVEGQAVLTGLQYVMSLSIVIGVFIMVFRMNKSQTHAMNLNIKPVLVEELKHDFSNIAGNIEAKEQVQDIIDFIKEPEKYVTMGAKMPKGMIFYGPPGTGKTLMAKAIAKEAEVPFFSVSGSDFVQLYAGVGASRVRDLFLEARQYKKAVIFIDEIDAIGKQRSQNPMQTNDEKDQTLNALLTEMSGFKEDEGIVVIAATNRLDLLDEALLRPGRFDRHIEIGYPDRKAREAILKLHLKNKPISEDVDIESLAKETVYFTGAMLEHLANEAAIFASRQNEACLTKKHLDQAFYTVIAGSEKKDRSNIHQEDRNITAFHEAGHALVTKLVAPENRVSKVTIIPSTKGAGGFSMNIPKDRMYLTRQDILSQIKISLAGRAAEEIIFGTEYITTGASNDIEKATEAIKAYIIKYGMDEELGLVNLETLLGSQNLNQQLMIEKCSEKMKELYEQTKMLIQQHQSILHKIAEGLLEYETLNEKEIASFF